MNQNNHPAILATADIEKINDDLTRYWLDEHAIAVVLSGDAARHRVDTWAETIINMGLNWPADQPYLAVYDVSKSAVTPYTRRKSDEVAQTFLEKKGADYPAAYALVLSSGVTGHIMRMFAEREIRSSYPMWEVRVFTSLEKAVEWVRSMREPMTEKMQAYLANKKQ